MLILRCLNKALTALKRLSELLKRFIRRSNLPDFLRRVGCDQAQGYLIGRPMPAEQLAKRLRAIGNLLEQAA